MDKSYRSKWNYLERMKDALSQDQIDMLNRIYEPVVMGVPLRDSRRDVCILPDGEIRAYGRLYETDHLGETGQLAYLSSKNAGISWELHYSHARMNSCTYIEEKNIYITIADRNNNNFGLGMGLWVLRSTVGPDDENPEIIQIGSGDFTCSFLPQKSEYSDRIWFTTQRNDKSDINNPVCYSNFFYSDDFGTTWTRVELPSVQGFEIEFPHKGMRWCMGSGAEPTAIEISENKMMMIIRTPKDCFYLSYSNDGGASWSNPEPSCFYGTNTTAYLLKLSDGRILNFWNNTYPLPELDHDKTNPPLSEFVKKGHWEDVFTNRDAAHVAISEDGGKTFIGYRELILNPVRNNTDFRYIEGPESSFDKSVHQFQAFELPYNKILVSAGQNNASRRLVIFDLDWLYETEAKEDFVKNALKKITTHTYVKSVLGCQVFEAGNGHCSMNRAPSAFLVPNPKGGYGEVLNISKHHDDRLINDIGGATWNFPASKAGKISVEVLIAEKQAKFILADRWHNTCDEYAAMNSPFGFELDKSDVGDDYACVDIVYDTSIGHASVFIDGEHKADLKMKRECPTGLSYLIMQCDTDGESQGFYIKRLEKRNL